MALSGAASSEVGRVAIRFAFDEVEDEALPFLWRVGQFAEERDEGVLRGARAPLHGRGDLPRVGFDRIRRGRDVPRHFGEPGPRDGDLCLLHRGDDGGRDGSREGVDNCSYFCYTSMEKMRKRW